MALGKLGGLAAQGAGRRAWWANLTPERRAQICEANRRRMIERRAKQSPEERRAQARIAGLKGGRARARALSLAERARIAQAGGLAASLNRQAKKVLDMQ